jgi:hypothetical protein
MTHAEFGDQETGQAQLRHTFSSASDVMVQRILVTHNKHGDVLIVRRGDTTAWLDMGRDVALSLAMELIEHAQVDKIALAARLLDGAPRKQVA